MPAAARLASLGALQLLQEFSASVPCWLAQSHADDVVAAPGAGSMFVPAGRSVLLDLRRDGAYVAAVRAGDQNGAGSLVPLRNVN